MTEEELQQHRAKTWRLAGYPVRTIEEAKSFLDEVGFCLMFPMRSLPLVPTFIGAYAGSDERLPDGKHAYADTRTQPAMDLALRLVRERSAYEINFDPETPALAAAAVFPFFYAMVGDRNPKAVPKSKAQGAKVSPLAIKVFESIQKHGPLTTGRLQELISRELTAAALDRALGELWSILKIMRIDMHENDGATWELLYRWSPEAVTEGSQISIPEALSALVGKYIEAVRAAEEEDIEQFFSRMISRSKIREVLHALLAARELSLVSFGTHSLVELTPVQEPRPEPQRRRVTGRNKIG